MNKEKIIESIKKIKADSKKRKFKQRIDLIVNLKSLDLKKTDQQVDFYVSIPHNAGRKKSICALIGPELKDEGKNCDEAIMVDDFVKYQQNKSDAKKLAEKHDFFVAQATVMPKIAAAFGRVLGPRGKMPNPKAGCVVPPKANLKVLSEKLQLQTRVMAKTQPLVQCLVGTEDMKEEDVAENISVIYDQLIHHLPLEKNNIKSVFIKLTMGKAEKIE